MRQIALDTETTGILYYEGHKIIEIGCIEIIDRKITGNVFHSYLNPHRKIDEGAKIITGLTENFLKDKPIFLDIVDEFFKFINGADEIIIHNANFDVNFLNSEFKIANFKIVDFREYFKIFDTLSYARKKHPGKKNNLNSLCKRYNIDISYRKQHGALIDASLLAQVYLSMTSIQQEIDYRFYNLDIKNILKDLNVEIVKANIQEVKNHILYLRNIKKNLK